MSRNVGEIFWETFTSVDSNGWGPIPAALAFLAVVGFLLFRR